MKSILFLFSFVLVLPGYSTAQQLELRTSQNARDELLELYAEDQFGDKVTLPGMDDNPVLIFFMPKPDNRSKGEEQLNAIGERIRFVERKISESVQSLLIIEPYRTGLFFDSAVNSRLRDESYSAVTDNDGALINHARPEPGGKFFWIVDPTGTIAFESSSGIHTDDWAEAVLLLEKMVQD